MDLFIFARRGLCFLAVTTLTAAAAEIPVEFSAALGTGAEARLSLTDTSTGQSRWVHVGDDFAGYRVSAYAAKDEQVVLSKEGRQFSLKLKQSKVKPGSSDEEKAQRAKIHRAIMNNLRQFSAAADQFMLETGKAQASYDDLVGPAKYIKQLEPKAGEDYRGLVLMRGKSVSVTTADGVTLTYKP
jgi:type IV pilus assembly protein PilA